MKARKKMCSMVLEENTRRLDPARAAKLDALVRLLDDPSPVVRGAITDEFVAWGTDLAEDLRRLPRQPDEAGWKVLTQATAPQYRRKLRLAWPHWLNIADDRSRLERALTVLADFQNGPRWRPSLGELLDALAGEYRDREGRKSPEDLAQFLFQEKKLQGVKGGPFLSEHGNLAHVIEGGTGLPISLVCIYLLVGTRVGLDIQACNWPRHFLARFRDPSGLFIVDPANGGAVVDAETFLSMQGTSREAAEAVLLFDVDAPTIIARMLGNLVRACRNEAEEQNSLLFAELLRDIESLLRTGALC